MKELCKRINAINTANGWKVIRPGDWKDKHRVPAVLALIHSEVSEALEGFRHDDRENFDEEIADVMIRCFDLCGGLGIDIEAEIEKKLEANIRREYRHGGKRL